MMGLRRRLSTGSIVWLFVAILVALAFCSASSVRSAAQLGLPGMSPTQPSIFPTSLGPVFSDNIADDLPTPDGRRAQLPIGQLRVEWTAVCNAKSSDFIETKADSAAASVRERSEQSRTA